MNIDIRLAAQKRVSQLIELRRDIHQHPELSNQEYRTSALITDRLRAADLEVRVGVGAPTAVVAVLRGGSTGRKIGWRADVDALPVTEIIESPFRSKNDGVMHACGHDGHTAIAVTLAEILAENREALAGDVVFLFQPAEETFSGARPMIEAGALDDPRVDEVYALHLTTQSQVGWVQCTPGPSMASADFFDITISGIGGHGAYPHLSVDPITAAAQIVTGMQSLVSRETPALQPAVMTVGQVVAGSKHNVIPDDAILRGSIRTFDEGVRAQLVSRLKEFSEETARAHRCVATVAMGTESCPTSVNDAGATARAQAACAAEFGDAQVGPGLPVMASDDMALFLRERPGCYMRVGAAPEGKAAAPHHNSSFEIDERSLVIGLRAALAVVLNAVEQ